MESRRPVGRPPKLTREMRDDLMRHFGRARKSDPEISVRTFSFQVEDQYPVAAVRLRYYLYKNYDPLIHGPGEET